MLGADVDDGGCDFGLCSLCTVLYILPNSRDLYYTVHRVHTSRCSFAWRALYTIRALWTSYVSSSGLSSGFFLFDFSGVVLVLSLGLQLLLISHRACIAKDKITKCVCGKVHKITNSD